MTDPRMTRLAELLVNYSCEVKPGEKVYISTQAIHPEMDCEIIKQVVKAGGVPFHHLSNGRINRELALCASKERMEILKEADLAMMKQMDCYIAIRGADNDSEQSDVPKEKKRIVDKYYGTEVLNERVNNTKWVVLRWPTPSMAQRAAMSTEAFEDFYFDVCTLDYGKLAKAEAVLRERMDKADMVHILGPGDTDLRFSIKDIPAICCWGDRNIPDGEVYTAPVKDSVNGVIHYNAPTCYGGKEFDNIRLEIKDGKIEKATGSDTDGINFILDTDPGARYFGEFSLGVNPFIKKPMRDILFDEKISGSIHLTPGRAYEEAWNGNDSALHWDLVMIQTPEYGGGEIWFDDELIRKDGLFVPDYLQPLNPEAFSKEL
ncbi:MAG: aminopeptidase [Abditibacteriota bacterium]|nr:aminopeptidase [Abditibacteriota bacterium]